ncbi:AAA family ATPase [Streptomyces lydicus]
MLGHSGGAVGNACDTLVCRGEAERAGSNPRMYRATSQTAAATQATAVIAPGPSQPAPVPRSRPTPQPATAAPPPGGRPQPITRPNGQQYHPRALAQLPDVEALRRLREAGVAVLLYGPPGTGKTTLIEAAFPDLITVAGDGDTTVGDLVGEYTQDENGGYEFIYGPLITAMQEGRALLLDDATLISPKVLAASLKINRTAVRVARQLATSQEAGEVGWAPQLRELIAFQKIPDVLGTDAAFANLVGIAPLEDRDTVADIVTKAIGRPVSPLALGRQL